MSGPTLHLVKLSVGSESVESLRAWQEQRLRRDGRLWHRTRMMPKRADEIVEGGGSIYWIIRGVMLCRQRITGFERVTDSQGRPDTHILLESGLIEVLPRTWRPFQGWRYLKAEDAPADLKGRDGAGEGFAEMPQELLLELRDLGVL